jgi:hypothetical protein
MNSYSMTNRQAASTVRRWLVSAVALMAIAAAVTMLAACGSPSSGTAIPSSPTPTASEPAGPAGTTAPAPTANAGGNPGAGDAEQAPPPQPLQIEVTTSPPTVSAPCHPSGTIVVSGGGSDSADSTQVPDSADYPLDVTYQWFIRKADPEQNPVPIGLPGTLQFNVAGGIPVSGPELTPAPGIEVELRVVAPEPISGGWITYPGCV